MYIMQGDVGYRVIQDDIYMDRGVAYSSLNQFINLRKNFKIEGINQERVQCKSHRLVQIVMSIESSKLQAIMSYDATLTRNKTSVETCTMDNTCVTKW